MSTRFRVEVPGKLHLSVDRSGTGSSTCVFIHGLADGGYVWNEIRGSLGSSFVTISVDLRGHGTSDWARPDDYSLHNYVSDVEYILESLGVQDCILIGHSLG